jgi:hypothetical protein
MADIPEDDKKVWPGYGNRDPLHDQTRYPVD